MASIGGPSTITTKDDLELQGLNVGRDAARAAEALIDKRNSVSGPGTYQQAQAQSAEGATLTWSMLQQRHPEWSLDYWQECRALYAGGKRLLCDQALMRRLFPANPHEDQKVYTARRDRAHYFPYPGTIIDALLAGLSSDPLRVSFGSVDPTTGDLETAPQSDWWQAFIEDVSDESAGYESDLEPDDDDDNASGLPMHHFLVEVMREALTTRFTWIRCDLPVVPDDAPIDSALAEERAGLKSPYLCLVPAEQVIDWEYGPDGELAWLLTLEKTTPRASIRAQRGKIEHHCYVLWTQTDFARYEFDVNIAQPIPESTPIQPTTPPTAHKFGCVPFDRVMLPEGLWAMGKLHSLAREHFNKRCAMSWAEYKALFPILYEFLDTNASGGEIPAADDPGRATDQVRSQGHTQIRAGNDKAQYIGPDVGPFKEARESCNDTMREMHRVMYSMALSANMDKQALSRSGDSKQQDQASTQIVMMMLGLLMRRIARVLLALVARGRGEAVPPTIVAGLEHFDTTGVTQAITDAVQVFSGIPISKSKTAYSLFLTNVIRKILGDTVTDDQVTQIRDEITETLSQEELMQQMLATPEPGQTPPTEGDDDDEDGEDGDKKSDDDAPPTPPRVGRIVSKPMKG